MGDQGYGLSIGASGQPGPSGLISGDSQPTSLNRMTQEVDISGWGGTSMVLDYDYRALSDTATSTVTNALMWVYDADTDEQLAFKASALGGTTDSGWKHTTFELTFLLKSATKIRLELGLRDGWGTNYNQNTYFDNVVLKGD